MIPYVDQEAEDHIYIYMSLHKFSTLTTAAERSLEEQQQGPILDSVLES